MGRGHAYGVNEPSRLQMLIERDLAEKRLGTLPDFVARRRATSSWTGIARDLSEATGREVSDETVRRWFADRVQVEVTIDAGSRPGGGAGSGPGGGSGTGPSPSTPPAPPAPPKTSERAA